VFRRNVSSPLIVKGQTNSIGIMSCKSEGALINTLKVYLSDDRVNVKLGGINNIAESDSIAPFLKNPSQPTIIMGMFLFVFKNSFVWSH